MKPDDDAQRDQEFARLDALLDELPAPVEPPGLAERVLAATASERAGQHPAARGPRAWRPVWIAMPLAAAAGLALWFGGLGGADRQALGPNVPSEQVADLPTDPDLLRELELLEDWELLVTDDLDVLLAELDEVDELLLNRPDDEEVEQG
ncbi:MAG: hypothetical protein AAFZ65_04060 [Planctomycetota bacterium]